MAACVSALLLGSCSLILEPKDAQCRVDDDCTARGPAFASSHCVENACVSRWSCLGSVPPPVPSSRVNHVEILVTDAGSRAPVTSGVVARVCGRLDPECITPLTPDQPPDENGVFAFDLQVGVPVMVQVRSDNTATGIYVPGRIFFTPIDADSQVLSGVQLITPQALSLLTLTTHQELPDETAGVVVVLAQDCFRLSASGVSFSLASPGPKTHAFFFQGGSPSPSAVETDPSGIGGFVNVPPGMQSLTATRRADGASVAVINLTVSAGTISYAPIPPTPLSTSP